MKRCIDGVDILDSRAVTLTFRQLQTLSLVLQVGYAEAANEMGVSPQTVKNTLNVLYRKLGVRTMGQAAIRLDWLRVPSRWRL